MNNLRLFFSNFGIGTKLTFSNLVYIVPVLVLTYFMVSSRNETIDFAKGELKGNRYQRPLMKILKGVVLHGVYSEANVGDTDKTLQTQELKEIEKSIAELTVIDQEIGQDLQFTADGLKQRKREKFNVTELKKNFEALSAVSSREKHLEMIGTVRGMISHLGDTSNLVLDPDLDSYYLMDITLITIPQMLDRYYEVFRTTIDFLKTKDSAKLKVDLAVLSALFKQSDMDRLMGDAQTAINEDKNFYGLNSSFQSGMPKWSKSLEEGSIATLTALSDMSSGKSSALTSQEFQKIISSQVSEVSHSWTAMADSLDSLFNSRIGFHVGSRTSSLLLSLIAVLVAAVLSTLTGLNIRKSVMESVSGAVDKIRSVSNTIQDSNSEIIATSNSLSEAVTEQSSAVTQTVANIGSISDSMKNTLANAQSSVEESSRAQESAAVGKEVVQELVTSMNDISTSNTKINEQLEKTNTKFKEIVTIISKISELTKVIHDIVFQTKLLSFNASVEAARAGEHGKGFSVVAEEVGALAEKSGKAAQEISAVVDSSVQKVKESIEQMNSEVKVLLDDGKLKVSKGVESANRCNGVLTELSKNVTVVNQMVQEIVENFKFQSEGVQEISKAMTQLNDVTQQNAVGSNRTASFARALGIESQSLLTVVGELESTVSDGRSNSNQNSISNAA